MVGLTHPDDTNVLTCEECAADVLRSRCVVLDGTDSFRQYHYNESPGPIVLCPHCGSHLE